MSVSSATIATLATPMEVAEFSDHHVYGGSDGHWLTCPFCQDQLWLVGSSYFCKNFGCPFLTGSPLDFLSYLASGDYGQGYDALHTMFTARFRHLTLPSEALRQQVAVDHQRNRELLMLFIEASRRTELPHELALAKEYFTRADIDSSVLQRTAAVMGRPELDRLIGLLVASGAQPFELPESLYLAIPYFRAHHEIDAILFYHPYSQKHVVVRLNTSRFSYSGLWMHYNNATSVILRRDCLSAMKVASQRKSSESHLGVLQSAKVVTFNPFTRKALFLVTDLNDLPVASDYHVHVPTTQFIDSFPHGLQRSFEDFMYESLEQSLQPVSRGVTTATYGILDAVRLSPHQLSHLRLNAKARGQASLEAELQRLECEPVIAETKQMTIHATPGGYIARQSGRQEQLSNFRIHFQGSTSFPEVQALFYNGELVFGGNSYPLMLAQTDLVNLRRLLDEAQRVVTLKEGSRHGIPFLSTSPAVKAIQTHWMQELSQLPCRPGIPFLGWDGRRELFYAPTWYVGMDGVWREPRAFHPDVVSMDCYSQAPIPEVELEVGDLPVELCDLISMVVASILRGKLRYPTKPIEIQHDKNAARIVEGLFRGLGQVRAVTNPTTIKGLQLYPYYSYYPLTRNQLDSMLQPVFNITVSERAFTLRQVASDDQLDRASQLLSRLVFRTVELLLEDTSVSFGRMPHVFYPSQLCQEGCRWIRQFLQIPNWPISLQPLRHLQAAIEGIAPKHIGDAIRYQAGADPRAFLRRDKLIGDPIDLELELQWLDPSLQSFDDHFSVSYPELARILACYYGQHVSIPAVDSAWLGSSDVNQLPA